MNMLHKKKYVISLLIFISLWVIVTACQKGATILPLGANNNSRSEEAKLISRLTEINEPTIGVHPFTFFDGFAIESSNLNSSSGVIGHPSPVLHPAYRDLVRRGAAALPILVAHLNDATPTKLVVGRDNCIFCFQSFKMEYDPKTIPQSNDVESQKLERRFNGNYLVKIGDICFAIIGQIVNRSLLSVRYEPTDGMVVNSPIEMPELGKLVTQDWQNATSADLEKSLIEDLKRNTDSLSLKRGAVIRLRHYFPDTYQKLRVGELGSVIMKYDQEAR